MKDIMKQVRSISLVAAGVFVYLWVAGAVWTALPDTLDRCGHRTSGRPEPHCHDGLSTLITVAWPIGIPVALVVKAGANIFNSGAEQWVK